MVIQRCAKATAVLMEVDAGLFSRVYRHIKTDQANFLIHFTKSLINYRLCQKELTLIKKIKKEMLLMYLVMNGIYMKITELFINLFEERAETRQEVAEKVHKFLEENYPPA